MMHLKIQSSHLYRLHFFVYLPIAVYPKLIPVSICM
jgi:hypothetical protein